MIRKIRKLVLYLRRYDVFKSICWYIKLNIPRTASFHVYPNSIVDIQKGAVVDIQKGEFAINASWFETRNRRFVSELRVLKKGKLIADGNFTLYQGASVHVGEGATLKVGANSFLNTNSTLNCFQYIEIGAECAISDNVCIHDSDSHVLNENKDNVHAPVKIEDHVWIGKNVTILKGVTIGNGAIVGAGSVVTKSIPPKCLAVGNPARVIKENVVWE